MDVYSASISWRYTEIYYCRHIMADILLQIYYGSYISANILQQIYWGRYVTAYVYKTADILWQIYYCKLITADISQQIYCGICITANTLWQTAIVLRQIYYGLNITAHIYIYIYIAYDKNGHISTNVQRQKLSIAASESACCNSSSQRLLSGMPRSDTTQPRTSGNIQTRYEEPILIRNTTEPCIADMAEILDMTQPTRP